MNFIKGNFLFKKISVILMKTVGPTRFNPVIVQTDNCNNFNYQNNNVNTLNIKSQNVYNKDISPIDCISIKQNEIKETLNYLFKYLCLSLNHFYFMCFLYNTNKDNAFNKLSKPYLGCSLIANTSTFLGMRVILVKDDSPASRYGLKVNDVIIQIDGNKVNNIEDYQNAIGNIYYGESKTKVFKILREDNIIDVDIDLCYE
jgi:S1-C subfamily serine protease